MRNILSFTHFQIYLIRWACLEQGTRIGLGFNIYQKDFNADEILNYCILYGIINLRVAVSKPIFGDFNKNVIFPADYSSISSKVANFIIKASELNLKVDLDCTLPKCFFTNEDLGRIVKYQPELAKGLGACGIAFDISPNLEIYRCFATSSIFKDKLTNYNTISEALSSFKREVDDKFSVPTIFTECKECPFALNMSCAGDCLVFNENRNIQDSPTDIIEQAYNCLKNNQLDEAFVFINRLEMNNATSTLLAAYYYYYLNDSLNTLRFARLTINLSTMKNISQAAITLIKSIEN